jgi:prevent-host-death family protein
VLQQVSIAEARNNLSKLVRAAEQREPIELTRRGQPVVVLVSADESRRLTERSRTRFAQAVREVRALRDRWVRQRSRHALPA